MPLKSARAPSFRSSNFTASTGCFNVPALSACMRVCTRRSLQRLRTVEQARYDLTRAETCSARDIDRGMGRDLDEIEGMPDEDPRASSDDARLHTNRWSECCDIDMVTIGVQGYARDACPCQVSARGDTYPEVEELETGLELWRRHADLAEVAVVDAARAQIGVAHSGDRCPCARNLNPWRV